MARHACTPHRPTTHEGTTYTGLGTARHSAVRHAITQCVRCQAACLTAHMTDRQNLHTGKRFHLWCMSWESVAQLSSAALPPLLPVRCCCLCIHTVVCPGPLTNTTPSQTGRIATHQWWGGKGHKKKKQTTPPKWQETRLGSGHRQERHLPAAACVRARADVGKPSSTESVPEKNAAHTAHTHRYPLITITNALRMEVKVAFNGVKLVL